MLDRRPHRRPRCAPRTARSTTTSSTSAIIEGEVDAALSRRPALIPG
ncbi:MAG: hypothetical protein R3F30_12660 [Planctomycetota bacterium]